MPHNLRPFRSYDENDVLNVFTFSGACESPSIVLTKGAFVKVVAPGFQPVAGNTLGNPIESLGAVGASYNNVVSDRYGALPKVTAATSGTAVLGITLIDIRELDENGEKLVFNPRKAAEMGVVVPVLTRGVVLYSGVTATAGQVAQIAFAGEGEIVASNSLLAGATKVGTFLGTSVNGIAPLKIEL
jgi:hypothetical protein